MGIKGGSFFPGGMGDVPRPPEASDLTDALKQLNATIDKMMNKAGAYAQVPGAGFWGTNATAPIPAPMPGSAAAMISPNQFGGQFVGPMQGQMGANPNQYGAPIGPQQQWSMGYSPHSVGGAQPGAGIGMDVLGFIPQALAGAANYAGAKTPYGTTGTTDQLGLNLEMGMLKQLSQVAGKIPGLGAYAEKQFEGLEEAVYGPGDRARGQLSPTFERMAKAGISVSDKEIDEAFRFAIPMERRGVYMKQRMDRIGAAVNAENALSSALSQIGM